jgi:hypothetical protein
MSRGHSADKIFEELMRVAEQQNDEMYVRSLAYHSRKDLGLT